MRDLIILAGGYGLDTMSASAVRALGLAQMMQSLGFRVIVLGKFRELSEQARTSSGVEINGVTCRDIVQPIAGRPCASYVHSTDSLIQVIDEQGADQVRALIAYNYPARGAWAIHRQVQLRGIAMIHDITEWYGWEGQKILRNLWRLAGVEVRMRLLTRLTGNVSCASRWFQAKIPSQHTVLWPFVLDTTRPEWQRVPAPDPTTPAHLVYSGSPGLGMHKDRLPVMFTALARLATEGHNFRITIAGMTEAQYLKAIPSHRPQLAALGNKLRFIGRIPHSESLELLRTADFLVFFRKPNRVSNTGFPTKFVEAATLGVPVISNPTSDIPLYLRDGENGILARSFDALDIEEALRRAVTLSPQGRAKMVATCRTQNPFDLHLWKDEARTFLENLRGLSD